MKREKIITLKEDISINDKYILNKNDRVKIREQVKKSDSNKTVKKEV